VSEREKRLGSSGVFKIIVDSARKITRALSESDGGEPLSPEAQVMGDKIAQAFVAGRFADVYEMSTPLLKQRQTGYQFTQSWTDAVASRGPLTGYETANAGDIDLQYIPGLENVRQDALVAFVEIAFSTPDIPAHDEKAFAVGIVLLDEDGRIGIGAIHAR
jgi:hypothetical protein